MKKLFITLFLMVSSLAVFGQDYYWYNGEKIPLERGVRKYIIYEDDLLKESDKAQIVRSEDVFYDEIPNLKWGVTRPHANIEDTAHVHYCTISYRKDGDYYDNMYVTHRFYVRLKDKNDLSILKNMADQYSAEIESEGAFQPWYILRCKLKSEYNALELANIFYESGLYSATEPEFINIVGHDIGSSKPKSLCDEWNVWYEGFESYGPINFNHLIKYQLTTDTIINEQRYVKLVSDEEYSPYRGALREGNNRDIYCIPAGSAHEYLLYAFNAKVGDRLTNLYLGDLGGETGYDGVVESISDGLPRVFTLRIAYPMEENMESGDSFLVRWIEGVGSSETPMGMAAVPSMTVAADVGVYTLLCAYKNGEQIYTSEYGEMYGCEYNRENNPADTIPLYIKDGPGSSTVEPVDPNEIVALLQKDQLSIYEYIDKELTLVLTIGTSNNLPARARQKTNDTFLHNMSVQLTEEGLYTIQLTNPEWDYIIEGKFMYPYDYQAIEATEVPVSLERKILRDGQLLIMHNSRLYTPMGTQVQ